MPGKKEYIRINPADSVAVACSHLRKEPILSWMMSSLHFWKTFHQGHKFALHTIEEGEPVIKYGIQWPCKSEYSARKLGSCT